jgi:hypothetical protein
MNSGSSVGIVHPAGVKNRVGARVVMMRLFCRFNSITTVLAVGYRNGVHFCQKIRRWSNRFRIVFQFHQNRFGPSAQTVHKALWILPRGAANDLPEVGASLCRTDGARDLCTAAHWNPSLPGAFRIAGGSSRVGCRRLRVNVSGRLGGNRVDCGACCFRGPKGETSNSLCRKNYISSDSAEFVCAFKKISTRLVVQTAIPVPKKSASSVHIG